MARHGFVWALSHSDWLGELLVSAASAARQMPDAERLLYATPDIAGALEPGARALFDAVIGIPAPRFRHRPRFDAMRLCPLDRAVFLDSDTYLAGPVGDLFEVLDHYEMAALPAPHHIHPLVAKTGLERRLPRVSPAVPEVNSGVLACRMGAELRALVERWAAHFATCLAAGYGMDQFALRVALAESPLRLAPLANTLNFRAGVTQLVEGPVRIVHAHGDLPRIAEQVNASAGTRFYRPDERLIHGLRPAPPTP